VKKFCIIANAKKDVDYIVSGQIKDYLTSKGAECMIDKFEYRDCNCRYNNPDNIPQDTGCIITVGGDGTLLQAAHDLEKRDAVFVGINKGNLGFLAEMGTDNIHEILDKLMSDDFKIEERMMLKAVVKRDNKVICESVALNDVVIHRNGAIRVCDYNICVNGLYLNRYQADGLIVATPTGSTAYSLSAGGPVVEPNASLMVLTPICSHSINGKSIIFSSKDTIDVEICPSRNGMDDTSIVAFDGFCSMEIHTGDIVSIKKAYTRTKLAKFNDSSFLQVLKDKMGDS